MRWLEYISEASARARAWLGRQTLTMTYLENGERCVVRSIRLERRGGGLCSTPLGNEKCPNGGANSMIALVVVAGQRLSGPDRRLTSDSHGDAIARIQQTKPFDVTDELLLERVRLH